MKESESEAVGLREKLAKMREECERITEEALVVKATTKQKEIDLEEMQKVSISYTAIVYYIHTYASTFFIVSMGFRVLITTI